MEAKEYQEFDVSEMRELLVETGLMNPGGKEYYKERLGKHQQTFGYLKQVKSLLKKMSTKKTNVLLDCGCGRSYLSFLLNYYLEQEGFRNIYYVGIDTNEALIQKCTDAAEKLNMSNMEFHHGSIVDCKIDQKPDIVYSLHACDTATDQTISRGVLDGARYILSVSCCQHTAVSQIKKHPLTNLTRHSVYKERIADMIADSMRALLLESQGYRVDIFEFVSARHTPKNNMLRAEKGMAKKINVEKALSEYLKLKNMFHIRPATELYLEKLINMDGEEAQ